MVSLIYFKKRKDLKTAVQVLRAAGFLKVPEEITDIIKKMEGVIILKWGREKVYFLGDENRAFSLILQSLGYIDCIIGEKAWQL